MHAKAPAAHAASEAAHRQGKFWEMHDRIFANQRELSQEKFIQYAQEIGLETLKVVRRAAGIGAYAFGALTGASYATFLGLRAAAERALHGGDLDEAVSLATELLRLAAQYDGDWYRGNAIHHGHLIAARAVAEGAGLARVVFLPSRQPLRLSLRSEPL